MSKGSRRRPTQISRMEEELRWELIKSTTNEERKQQIREQLKQFRAEIDDKRD